jgi:uncharacterized protein YdbL (DUF1318 family)
MKITAKINRIATVLSLLCCAVMANAWAAQYDIKEMTPDVQNALNNRSARYESLQSLKAAGQVGENSRGYVEALNGSSAGSAVVSSENADRRIIYQAIVKQNALPSSALAQVEEAFAEVQRDKARPGDSIQMPSGQWKKK